MPPATQVYKFRARFYDATSPDFLTAPVVFPERFYNLNYAKGFFPWLLLERRPHQDDSYGLSGTLEILDKDDNVVWHFPNSTRNTDGTAPPAV